MKTNNNYKWYVASQDFPKDVNSYHDKVYFIRLTPNKDCIYEYETYVENATPMVSQEEAEMYAFALNFNQNRNWSDTYFFPIAVNITNLPKLPEPIPVKEPEYKEWINNEEKEEM